MKIRKQLFISAVLSTVFALGVSASIFHNAPRKEADAYGIATLPTTIDLNDCTEQEIRSYYSKLDSYNTSERQGTNLLKNLKPILSKNQKYYSYDEENNNKIWRIYEISDRDWEKSPASSITCGSYNPSTNKITNYTYNSDNPYLHALYVNRNVENQTRAWGDHGNSSDWGMNREHIWAKSHGFQADGQGGARGDPIHLWAANGYANNIHSNNFYAFVDKTKSYTDCGDKHNNIYNNLSGKSKNAGGSQTIFEPQDCDKGDIARSIFYMAARYNNYAGDDDAIDTNNPNLVLANSLSENGTTGTSTASRAYAMGLLSDLLAWNKLDPVDEYEIHRNNLLYKNYTNNRNPFIDFPEWADAIWGTADLDGTNYNPSISSYASPASDPIGTSTVAPAFAISTNSLDLEVEETANISASNAESTITWTVGNDSIVSLNKTTTTNNESVTITALVAGTTTITATSGSDSATCTVTVSEPVIPSSQVTLFTANLTTSASVNNGFDITYANVSAKTGFYQDGGTADSSINYFKVLRDTPLFIFQPASITFTARLGSGSNKNPLTYNVEACLVDSDGNEITSTKRTVTTSITYAADDYEIELPYSADAYGAKIMHMKANGHNIRYYTFSLSYEGSAVVAPQVEDYLDVTSSVQLLATESTSQGSINEGATFSARMENEEVLSDLAIGDITLTGAKGTHANSVPTYYSNGSALRMYVGNTLTFTAPGNITRINFTFTSSNDVSALSSDDAEYSSELGVWECSSETVVFNVTAKSRISSVSVTYEVGAVTTVTSAGLRFSASVAKDTWAAIEENWDISEYGFMLFKTDSLNGLSETPVKDRYDSHGALATAHSQSGAVPTYEEGDNYVFSVKVTVSTYAKYFCAAAYFVIDDVYYFLPEQQKSVKGLAEYHIANGGTTISSAALGILAAPQTNN